VETPQPASSAVQAIESDIFRMKIPGKVCSPRLFFTRGEVLIGRIQTNRGSDHPLAVAGARGIQSINFS
jgi:hypothetical protein